MFVIETVAVFTDHVAVHQIPARGHVSATHEVPYFSVVVVFRNITNKAIKHPVWPAVSFYAGLAYSGVKMAFDGFHKSIIDNSPFKIKSVAFHSTEVISSHTTEQAGIIGLGV